MIVPIVAQDEHSYIFSSGKDVQLKYWGRLVTSQEKPELLDWEEDRIIKSVYFKGKDGLYLAVAPITTQIKQKIFAKHSVLSGREAKSMTLSDILPYRHVQHSSGPFILDEDLGLVKKILFHDFSVSGLVDYSYPGRADISVHMDYQDSFDMLKEKYGTLIEKTKLDR